MRLNISRMPTPWNNGSAISILPSFLTRRVLVYWLNRLIAMVSSSVFRMENSKRGSVTISKRPNVSSALCLAFCRLWSEI